jgi:hypothetical protein
MKIHSNPQFGEKFVTVIPEGERSTAESGSLGPKIVFGWSGGGGMADGALKRCKCVLHAIHGVSMEQDGFIPNISS